MATYTLTVHWEREPGQSFVDSKYSRGHRWVFDGGIEVRASSSPHVVPLPMSLEAAVDPEEAFVASIASCHMLWFLSIAAARNFVVDRYEDHPEGTLAENGEGKLAMTSVDLKPSVSFFGAIIPSAAQVDELHNMAHEKCFIANSVKTVIRIIGSESV